MQYCVQHLKHINCIFKTWIGGQAFPTSGSRELPLAVLAHILSRQYHAVHTTSCAMPTTAGGLYTAQAGKCRGTYQWHLSLEYVLPERRRGEPAFLSADVAVDMQSEAIVTAKTPFREHLIPALTCFCFTPVYLSIVYDKRPVLNSPFRACRWPM